MQKWEENERKKEYLKSYGRTKRRERLILEEIQELRMDEMFPSMQGDGMPRGSSQHDLSDYAIKLDKLQEKLKIERGQCVNAYARVRISLNCLDDDLEREVMERRYILLQKWEEIAVKMGMSYRHVIRIHGSALGHYAVPPGNTKGKA